MRIQKAISHTMMIERSEFICYLERVFNEEEARSFITKIRKMHPQATHVCTAFIIHQDVVIERTNDDGEPSGTAGNPMLNSLKMNNLTEVCACVVRYFGGIKLGAGGLIRAYSKSVSETIKLSNITTVLQLKTYALTFPYSLIAIVDNNLPTKAIVEKDYDIDVTYIVSTQEEAFCDTMINVTNGKIAISYLEDTTQEVLLKEVL